MYVVLQEHERHCERVRVFATDAEADAFARSIAYDDESGGIVLQVPGFGQPSTYVRSHYGPSPEEEFT